jgi:hypothetical protein
MMDAATWVAIEAPVHGYRVQNRPDGRFEMLDLQRSGRLIGPFETIEELADELRLRIKDQEGV